MLHAGGVPLPVIAEAVGTPVHVYPGDDFDGVFDRLLAAELAA